MPPVAILSAMRGIEVEKEVEENIWGGVIEAADRSVQVERCNSQNSARLQYAMAFAQAFLRPGSGEIAEHVGDVDGVDGVWRERKRLTCIEPLQPAKDSGAMLLKPDFLKDPGGMEQRYGSGNAGEQQVRRDIGVNPTIERLIERS